MLQFSCSVWSDSATPWTAARQASLSNTNSQSLLKPRSIELAMPSNHLILCHPLLPPSIFPSIRIFSSESVLRIRWPKYWSFSFSTCPSNEYSGLISFRTDWFDLYADQGTPKSLLQHHSSKASGAQLSLQSNSHIYTRLLEKPQLRLDGPLLRESVIKLGSWSQDSCLSLHPCSNEPHTGYALTPHEILSCLFQNATLPPLKYSYIEYLACIFLPLSSDIGNTMKLALETIWICRSPA